MPLQRAELRAARRQVGRRLHVDRSQRPQSNADAIHLRRDLPLLRQRWRIVRPAHDADGQSIDVGPPPSAVNVGPPPSAVTDAAEGGGATQAEGGGATQAEGGGA